jgi:hypothetical protein
MPHELVVKIARDHFIMEEAKESDINATPVSAAQDNGQTN